MKPTIFSMTRFATLAFLAITLALAGCGSTESGGSGKPTLNIYSGGDVNVQSLWQDTLIPEFKKSHPDIDIRLVFSEHGTNNNATLARLSAAVDANKDPGMDIVESITTQAVAANLLHPLTTKEIPLLERIEPTLLEQSKSLAVPYRASSVVLAYNSEFVKDPPKTLKDLLAWVKANPGKFTYNSPDTGGSGGAFAKAVVRSYISEEEQKKFITGAEYDVSLESQWEPGLTDLKALKPFIYGNNYPNGNKAVLELLGNGSIWVAPVWSDQALTALDNKQLPESVKLVQIDPPFSGGPAFLGIPRTSKNIALATTFLNWLLEPDTQAKIIDIMHGYPGVKWEHVPQEVRDKYASIASSYAHDFQSKFDADFKKMWQTQVAGG